ncbi:MAG: ASKHA domain-containing protein [Actinobacteria bacterium]|nr:ASKHA domain-containing protein [Actinomycetota bacterium]
MNKEYQKYLVKFLPGGKEIKVIRDYNLRQAILDCGLELESSCAGAGTCGKCRVKIIEGNVSSKKSKFIDINDKENGYVLACASKIKSDLIVEIPEFKKTKTRIEKGAFSINKYKKYAAVSENEFSEVKINPWLIKETIKIEKPKLGYSTSDLYRLEKSIKNTLNIEQKINIPIDILRKLPFVLREKDWQVTVTIDRRINTLIDIKAGEQPKKNFGIAVDIGTTTIVLYLVDLNDGRIVDNASDYNPQIKFGEDIINRIVFSLKRYGLSRLRSELLSTINNLISELINNTGIDCEDVYTLMVAGNSTMMHIFYGVPPRFIREDPYVIAANKFPEINSAEAGIKSIKNATVYSINGVASYIGADITSGISATKMAESKDLILFIDLGTNGEMVVGNCEWMIGCSCSAGPAFEGGGVDCGIRAVDGAIEKVLIDEDTFRCEYEVIGDCQPVGICGSGLLDIMGEMFLKGIIDRKGKFNKDIKNPYLKCVDNDCQYIIVDAKESGSGKDIYISEVDINNLMRAKAAIYSGIKTLLEEVGLEIYDIKKVYIAGGMGKNLNIQNAILIGMLPDINLDKYFFLGNTSITGAYMSLLSENKYNQTAEIANKITYLELSMNMKFMDRYIAGLFLPYTDLTDFPNVESMVYPVRK